MRTIDADALLKIFGFTEDCTNCKHRYNDMLCESVIWRDVCDAIFEAPTIDAVSVVRCKDCKWWHDNRTLTGFCERLGTLGWFSTDYSDYCSFAERRNDE